MKFIFYLLFSVIIIFNSYADFLPYSDYATIKELHFPVTEGSENELRIRKYIADFSSHYGIIYNENRIDNDYVLTNSYNVELTIKGKKTDGTNIILFVPLNSFFIRGRYYDVSINQFIALEAAKILSENPPERDIVIIFTGACENITENENWGRLQYIENHSGKFDSSIIILSELMGDRGEVFLSGSLRKKAVSKELLSLILSCISGLKTVKYDYTEILASRLGFYKSPSESEYFKNLNASILSMRNHDGYAYNSGGLYTKERISELIYFLNEFLRGLSSFDTTTNPDYNYQVLFFKDRYLFVSETLQVILYLLLISFLIFSRRIILYFRSGINNITMKSLPFLIVIFIIYYLSSLFIYSISVLYDSFTVHNINYAGLSFLYFTVIFLIPLFFIIAVSDRFRKMPMSGRNVVFIYGATFFSYVNFIISLFVNISLAYIYLIVIFMLVLSHLTGKKILLKYLVYFGAFLPFAVIILVLSFRHENIINDFFAKPFLLHFLFCYFSFPFFLIFLRVNRINKIKYKMQSNAFFAYFWIILLFIIFFLFYSIDLINVHESEKIARIVFENNYITGESFFHIKPLHSAGIVNVKAGSEYYKVKPNEEKVIKSNAAEKPYSTELIKRGSRVTFRLISSEKIKNLFVTIKCPEGVIFSSINQRYSFMYKNEKAGADYYKVWIPSNPGNEVFINLEFLRGHEYQIVYRVEYNFLKDGELETDFDFVEYKTIYEDEVSVKL